MISFFLLLFLLIKLSTFLLYIFILKYFIVKIIFLIIGVYFLHYLNTEDIRRRKVLSKLRAWKHRIINDYPIRNFKEHLWNLFILILYPLIFVGGILWLRFNNTAKYVDLLRFYYEFKYIIDNSTTINIITSFTIIVILLIIYFKLLSKIKNYFKFQYSRRLIYLDNNKCYFDNPNNILHKILNRHNRRIEYYNFMSWFRDHSFFTPEGIYLIICKTLYKIFDYFGMEEDLQYKIVGFLNRVYLTFRYNIHYIIMFTLVFYDIVFNNLILVLIFKALPYIFIYDIMVKLNKFFNTWDPQYDSMLNGILYGKVELVYDAYYDINGRGSYEPEDLMNAITYALDGMSTVNTKDVPNKRKAWANAMMREIRELLSKQEKNTTTPFIEKVVNIVVIVNIIIIVILIIILSVIYIYNNNFK